ncbi:hypothetical protein ON010_g7960 [Phytophthora cinnamomi]|nr:hypothetical protein ON010_g7960 [Phytophthora cinnamomi]
MLANVMYLVQRRRQCRRTLVSVSASRFAMGGPAAGVTHAESRVAFELTWQASQFGGFARRCCCFGVWARFASRPTRTAPACSWESKWTRLSSWPAAVRSCGHGARRGLRRPRGLQLELLQREQRPGPAGGRVLPREQRGDAAAQRHVLPDGGRAADGAARALLEAEERGVRLPCECRRVRGVSDGGPAAAFGRRDCVPEPVRIPAGAAVRPVPVQWRFVADVCGAGRVLPGTAEPPPPERRGDPLLSACGAATCNRLGYGIVRMQISWPEVFVVSGLGVCYFIAVGALEVSHLANQSDGEAQPPAVWEALVIMTNACFGGWIFLSLELTRKNLAAFGQAS